MKLDKVNVIGALIATFFAALFGKYWPLFFGFLVFNIVDWITGWVKSRRNHSESSKAGAIGAMKKVGYWIVIGVAFFVSTSFIRMGEIIGVNLSFVQLFGWFTLASYLVNEIRSILENLVEMDIWVPAFLTAGLDVTQKLLDAETKRNEEENADENEGN